MKHIILLVVFMHFVEIVHSQNQSSQDVSSYSVFLDEDNFQSFGQTTDENYTLGFGVKVQNGSLAKNRLSTIVLHVKDNLGLLLHAEDRYFPDKYSSSLVGTSGSFMLMGTGFTPKNLNTSAIQYGDRPYSSIISITYGLNRLYKPENKNPRKFTTELSIGLLGSGVGAQLQTLVHQSINESDTKNPHTPKGWGNQISNGGEPTALILNRVEYLLYSIKLNPFKNYSKISSDSKPFRLLEFTYGKESFLGYYTGAAISFGTRLGILDSRNWTANNFPLQTGAMLVSNDERNIERPNPLAHSGPLLDESETNNEENIEKPDLNKFYSQKRHFELYISSELKPSIMLYNALLEGQFAYSPYTISGNNTNPFIYTWTNALVLNVPIGNSNINLMYNFYSYKSAEFRRANYYGESHAWGGGYFTFVYYPRSKTK